MALLWMDSFDISSSTADIAARYASSSHPEIMSTTTGRTGNCIKPGNAVGFFVPITLTQTVSAMTTCIFGIAVKHALTSGTKTLLRLIDSATVQVELRCATDGTVTLYNGSGSLITTLTNKLSNSSFNYIEASVTIGATGSYNILFNGTSDKSGTGNTKNSSNSTIDRVTIGVCDNSGSNDFFYLDDYYICNTAGSAPWNTFLSGGNPNTLPMIGTRTIISSGASSTWTAFPSGANYNCVNQLTQDGDTTYVYTSTIGNYDVYGLSTVALTGNPILGVQTTLLTKLDAAGSYSLCSEWRSGGTVYDGTSFTENGTSSYTPHTEIKMTDPNTSAQWTISGLNALQVGVKLVG